MFLKENVMLALAGLKSNKMRSLLTMLGIIIGISSVISIVSIGNALKSSVLDLMSDMGASNLYCYVYPKKETDGGPQESDYFSQEDIEIIQKKYQNQILNISITESFDGGYAKTTGYKSANISMIGVNEGYKDVSKFKLKSGRFFTSRDIKGNKKTAIVSDKLVSRLFARGENPIGKEIKVYTGYDMDMETYRIIGIYKYEHSMFDGGQAETEDKLTTNMYAPITTLKQSYNNKNYQSFELKPKNGNDSNKLVNELQQYLDKAYESNDSYGANVYNGQDDVSSFTDMLNIVSLVVSVIAAISLLVGGIGVMNIMLVSVTERTREIGTRKALGAKGSQIRMQFITEAVIICSIGGAIGITLGTISGIIACIVLKSPISISVSTILISLTFSMAIGVFFGYYPAKKAAKLDPIEALRYE